MSGRHRLAQAVAATAAGAALILLAAGRQWAATKAMLPGGTGRVALSVSGHQVAPSLPALGIAGLAFAVAVIAARGTLRRVVGVLVVFIGALSVGVSITAPHDVSHALEHREVGAQGIPVHASANGWWACALAGGILLVLAGAAVAVRSAGWSGLGARYDAPTAAPAPTPDPEDHAWTALDRGEDPTA